MKVALTEGAGFAQYSARSENSQVRKQIGEEHQNSAALAGTPMMLPVVAAGTCFERLSLMRPKTGEHHDARVRR